jgi:hypothetical protein
MDDSQQNRRDYGAQIVKTVYLPASSTPTEIYGILNVLRTALTLRGVYQHETARAIVIRDVPSRVALAERVIGHLNTSSTPIASVLLPSQGITENGSLGIASSARKQLQPAASGTASLNLNADARTAFETVGKIAGVAVTFHPRFTAGSASPLRVDGVDAVDLLDYVALVTGNIWKVVDSRTILVAPDSWETRRELESITTKVFTLQTNTPGHASGIGNVLRIVGGFRQVEQIGSDAVAVWDAPERIALAEQIVAALEKQP